MYMYALQLKVFGYLLRYMYSGHHSDQDWTETYNKATKMMKTFIKETTFVLSGTAWQLA